MYTLDIQASHKFEITFVCIWESQLEDFRFVSKKFNYSKYKVPVRQIIKRKTGYVHWVQNRFLLRVPPTVIYLSR